MLKQARHFYEFGPFRLDPVERLLFRDGQLISLTPKALETLLVLLEKSGHLVEKDELMSRVWPDAIVEEGGLAKSVSALRKALDDNPNEHRYIATIPGRGYCFIASVQQQPGEEADLIQEQLALPAPVIGEQTAHPEEESAVRKDEAAGSRRQAFWPSVDGKRNRRTGAALLLLVGLVIAATLIWLLNRSPQVETSTVGKSMAVLPFTALNLAGGDEYLGLGMADALITKLSSVGQIKVLPVSAVHKYAPLGQDPVAAGRALSVESVLEGSIQRAAERIRVTVRLVRVRDGTLLWADSFDGKFTDIFTVQDTISEQVAGALLLRLSGEERQRLTKRHTQNTEAYQLYLKGRYHWNKRTADGIWKALAHFRQAIEEDPGYALAYAGLADCYAVLSYYTNTPPKESFPRAKAAAIQSLERDEKLAEAHASLGWARLSYDWDWPGAEREFKRALELNPHYATARHWYGLYLVSQGRFEEAIGQIKQAQEMDPLSPIISTNLGLAYYYARDYEQAIAQSRRTLELDANFPTAYHNLGLAYLQSGKYLSAVAEVGKANALSSSNGQNLSLLGYVYAVSGRKREAQQFLQELQEQAKHRYVSPYWFALIHTGLEEKKQAFEWLHKAYDDRCEWLVMIKVEPMLDSLRSDPRFADLLQRVGFAPQAS
ncbi:MAG: tetratricopeptide repeat protein [Acidobacteria bacterium]|nr:tetratricopeptide repeat protein [Acidobacteriota bacterium]